MINKNVIFVSAGDNTNFYKYWIEHNKNYDLYICYYGESKDDKYKEYSNFYFKRKGSKIQNFYYLWNNILKSDNKIKEYENYYLADDDIIINTNEINELFNILEKYKLWILQPSFKSVSKISHNITKQIQNNFMRYTNFIEINTLFMSKYAITECMKIYNPILVGYGIDYLFIWHLGQEKTDKYAIVDSISCINPVTKIRQIDILQSLNERENNWNKIKNKLNIKIWKHKIFSYIK